MGAHRHRSAHLIGYNPITKPINKSVEEISSRVKHASLLPADMLKNENVNIQPNLNAIEEKHAPKPPGLFKFLDAFNPIKHFMSPSRDNKKLNRERIEQTLKRIESANKIKIFYAVDSGPRDWLPDADERFDSQDIRFLFIHTNESVYLPADENDDSVLLPTLDSSALSAFRGFADDKVFHGFDVLHALKLLGDMNPHLIEMLYSSTVYRSYDKRLVDEMRRLVATQQRVSLLARNYRLLAAQQCAALLTNKETLSARHYLTAIRPSLMADWLVSRHNASSWFMWHQPAKVVETDLSVVLGDVRDNLPVPVFDEVSRLMESSKTLWDAREPVARSKHVDQWMQRIILDPERRFSIAATIIDNYASDYDLQNQVESVLDLIFQRQ